MRLSRRRRVGSESAAKKGARSKFLGAFAMRSSYIRIDRYVQPWIHLRRHICEEVFGMSMQETVREKYGSIARSVSEGGAAACCDAAMRCCDPITRELYGAGETSVLPETAVLASLGCGNPTALTEVKAGEAVQVLGQVRG